MSFHNNYYMNSSCTMCMCIIIILLQFCDDVVMGMFPVSQEKLLKLAALRLQYLDGDYSAGSIMYVLCMHSVYSLTVSCTPIVSVHDIVFTAVNRICFSLSFSLLSISAVKI